MDARAWNAPPQAALSAELSAHEDPKPSDMLHLDIGSSVPRCLPTMPSAAVRSRCDGSRRDSAPAGSQPTDSPAGVSRRPTPHMRPRREFGGLSLLARSYACRLACKSSFPRLYRGSQCMPAPQDARACVTRWIKCKPTNGRCGLRAVFCAIRRPSPTPSK